MIEKFTVSRDDNVYQAWPDVTINNDGCLVCVFTECVHHADRSGSRLMTTVSRDGGETWSEKRPLTEKSDSSFFWNNARISLLNDGNLYIVCDKATRSENENSKIYLFISKDGGETWSEAKELPCFGIVPSKLTELKYGDYAGRRIIMAHSRDENDIYTVRSWYSDDRGKSWSGPVTVVSRKEYKLCEAAPIELKNGVLTVLLRENSSKGLDAFKTFSYDGGDSFNGLYTAPLPGCHRPVADYVDDETVLITYRFMQGGKGWLGHWTQNVFAAFMSDKDLSEKLRENQSSRIMPLDYDRSAVSDLGYTGFAKLKDGRVYVVNYIVDDAPKAHIRGYRFGKKDVIL